MQQLEQRLTRQLLQNHNVQLLNTSQWSIPCQLLEVEYHPVKRVKMDVLMKMLLLTFQQIQIDDCEEIAQLLHVELLFIEDLVTHLLSLRLIDKTERGYVLTEKGKIQLQEGIFEEQQPIEKQALLYSFVHRDFLTIEAEKIEEYDDVPTLYRHAPELAEEVEWNEGEIIAAMNHIRPMPEDLTMQTVITDVSSTKNLQILDSPCMEFVLYNRETDTVYVRIWHIALEKWDEVLEQHVTERDIVSLRAYYLENV